ncbi:MAG: autotransporter-associated beta strand repeat-containing protein [Pirellulales bacterium]|nr:autotransporter-associated beta strand repeat-containing protein [Pirellulales bacterium]
MRQHLKVALCFCLAGTVSFTALQAATVFWNVPSGDFAVGANWDTTTIPAAGDTAVIGNGGTATLSSVFPNALAYLRIGGGGAIDLAAGGTVSVSGVERISAVSAGALNFHGGTLRATGDTMDFVNGTKNYVHSEGAVIDTQGYTVVINNSGQLLAPLAGASGGLTKQGAGTLVLHMSANTYTGTTSIDEGALRIRTSLPDASFLSLNGGILESDVGATSTSAYTFTRTLAASGANSFQFTANGGGFAGGLGGTFDVKINNGTSTILWGSAPGDVGTKIVGTLKLSSPTSRARTNFNNGIDLNGADRTIHVDDNPASSSDLAVIPAVISNTGGTAGLVKTGTGTLVLTKVNTYDGTTTVLAGALQVKDGTGLPTNSFLDLSGGVLQGDGAATFSRPLGTSGNTFQLNNGGFSARAGAMTVNIGGASQTLAWGAAPADIGSKIVGVLKFGSDIANNVVTFQNGIDLQGADRTFQVQDNPYSDADYAAIAGTIADTVGTAGIVKTGDGVLALSLASGYVGDTSINAGALRADSGTGLPASSFLRLNGGVLQCDGTFIYFTRPLGTSGSAFQWTAAGGGFSSSGSGLMYVNIGGATQTLDWGSAPADVGGKITGPLKLGSTSSKNATTFENGINLNAANRTIQVDDNPLSNSDYAEITGVIYDGTGAGGIVKTGSGMLSLVPASFAANPYSGDTEIQAGAIQALDGTGLPANSLLRLNGGVFISLADFTRSLGTSGNAFSWDAGGGGFAAGTTAINVNVGGNATPTTLEWGAAPADVGGKIVGTLKLGTSTAGAVTTFQNGIDLKGGMRTIQVTDNTALASEYAQITGVISDSTGGGTLVLPGNGALMLAAENTFTGKTIVKGSTTANTNNSAKGQLILNCTTGPALRGPLEITTDGLSYNWVTTWAPNQFGPNVVVSFTTEFFTSELALLGNNQTVAGISCETGRGVIANSHAYVNNAPTASSILTIENGADYSYNGYMRNYNGASTQTLGLEKKGAGRQNIEGANISYTGPTTIGGGTLRLTDATAFASNITNNAALEIRYTGTGTWTYNKTMDGTGTLAKLGGGKFVLSGAAIAYSGATTVSEGKLNLTDTTAFAGDIKIDAALEMNYTTTPAPWTYNKILSGSAGTLAKLGAGTLNLEGMNTFSGVVTIGEGTLVLANSGQLPASIVNNATFLIADGVAPRTVIAITGTGTTQLNGSASLTTASIAQRSLIIDGAILAANAMSAGTATVPEPGTWLLLLVGSIGLAGWKYFNRRNKA